MMKYILQVHIVTEFSQNPVSLGCDSVLPQATPPATAKKVFGYRELYPCRSLAQGTRIDQISPRCQTHGAIAQRLALVLSLNFFSLNIFFESESNTQGYAQAGFYVYPPRSAVLLWPSVLSTSMIWLHLARMRVFIRINTPFKWIRSRSLDAFLPTGWLISIQQILPAFKIHNANLYSLRYRDLKTSRSLNASAKIIAPFCIYIQCI